MSVLRFAGDKFVGVEADLTSLTSLEGATFFATDTRKTYLNVAGDWEQIVVDAEDVIYDNTNSELVSNTVQGALDQLADEKIDYIVKSANYTAKAFDGVLTDTSGDSFTVTLPESPSEGDVVIVADISDSWSDNELTIARNGQTIRGVAEDLIADINGALIKMIFDGTTWQLYLQIGASDSFQAFRVSYDGTVSGLAANNVQEAIDEFAHIQNTDTKLAEGTADEVTAAEARLAARLIRPMWRVGTPYGPTLYGVGPGQALSGQTPTTLHGFANAFAVTASPHVSGGTGTRQQSVRLFGMLGNLSGFRDIFVWGADADNCYRVEAERVSVNVVQRLDGVETTVAAFTGDIFRDQGRLITVDIDLGASGFSHSFTMRPGLGDSARFANLPISPQAIESSATTFVAFPELRSSETARASVQGYMLLGNAWSVA